MCVCVCVSCAELFNKAVFAWDEFLHISGRHKGLVPVNLVVFWTHKPLPSFLA